MSQPVRLQKKFTREDYQREFNLWVTRNFGIVAFATIVIMLIIFIIVCYAIVGVSATDSGLTYNQIQKVI